MNGLSARILSEDIDTLRERAIRHGLDSLVPMLTEARDEAERIAVANPWPTPAPVVPEFHSSGKQP